MYRVVFLIVVVWCVFVFAGQTFAAADAADITMPASAIPVLKKIQGIGEQFANPGRYPEFLTIETSSDPACAGQASCANGLKARNYQPLVEFKPENYVVIPGWQDTEITIPEKNRVNSKLLIFWTIRVEAALLQEAVPINNLCPGWCGESEQKLKGGKVFGQLYVNGEPKGNFGSMTVPDFGNVKYKKEPPPPPRGGGDPTISGSVLLTNADFGGKFPSKINLEVRWFNDTAVKVRSLDRQRQIIVKIVPGQVL